MIVNITLLLFTLLSTFITIAAVLLLKPLAHKIELVDQPNALRKQHKGEVPLIGGICILFAVSVVCLLSEQSLNSFRSLFLGAGILLFIGVLDDFKSLSAKIRLLVQFLVVIIMIGQGRLELVNLGDFLSIGAVQLSPVYAMLLTFISVIALINAMNMLDGQDGLLGLISISQFFWLAVLAFMVHAKGDFHILMALIGALIGFLCFNLRIVKDIQARIFLGDAGSTVLGYITAWFVISLSQGHYHLRALTPVVMLWVLALPIFDLAASSIRRVLAGQSPLMADDGHLHHSLRKFGFSVRSIAWILGLSSFVLGGIGVVAEYYHCPQVILFVSFCGLFVVYLLSNRILRYHVSKAVTDS